MTTPKKRSTPLTKDEIFSTALSIVDAEGLDALTMRRLAGEVGVEAASLYHHVPSKDALIDGMLVRMRSEVRIPDPLPAEWIDIYQAIFDEYRRVLAAHPNLVMYAARGVESDPQPNGLEHLAMLGFSERDAVALWQSMIAFSVGYSMFSSRLVTAGTDDLPDGLASRMAEWPEETGSRTLRIILEGYATQREG